MLWFAYDGSLNGDWVSHYAVRLAKNLAAPEIQLVHVADGTLTQAQLETRLDFLRPECDRAGVTLAVTWLGAKGDVAQTLLDQIPAGPEHYVLCGTRIRQRNFSYLRGTVSERLFAAHQFNLMAVRVAQPGLLGSIHSVLAPVLGHPRGFRSGLPFVRLFGADLRRLHVFLVKELDRLRWRALTSAERLQLESEGMQYVDRIQRELRTALHHRPHIDGSVVVSDDAASEVVLAAKQHKSDLIYLGASERTVVHRLLVGTPLERILQQAPCDVAIYRGIT